MDERAREFEGTVGELVTGSAWEGFWAAVAVKFPEVESGDLAPGTQVALEEAMRSAILSWYLGNLEADARRPDTETATRSN